MNASTLLITKNIRKKKKYARHPAVYVHEIFFMCITVLSIFYTIKIIHKNSAP